ncbi:MAG: hypothetical protein PHQ50_00145 [Eubacteriales bacterium]|nr:hypothetical protein [Eubacteriales bacterium]MDD3349303.1 hypothetical protein [Eubacteriales bacterium]
MIRKKSPAAKLSFGGIMLGLSWITLFFAAFIPGMELTLFSLCTFYVVLVVGVTSVVNGWILYAATCLLVLVMIPDKIAILPYVFFFGLYGLVKFYIERIRKTPIEYLLKLLFFNLSWGITIFVFKSAFLSNIGLPDLPVAALVVGAQFMFVLYDQILTRLYSYFHRRFGRLIEGRMFR